MSQNLRNYTKALYGFDAVVRRVPADRWDAPSPCDGWTARDVVQHAAGAIDAVAEQARTGEVAMPASPDFADDPVGGWSASLDALLEALDRPGVINQAGSYWTGDSTIDDLLAFTTWDPLVHSWDLASAAGIEPHADQQLAETTLASLQPMEEMLLGLQLMTEPRDAPADADAYTRLLAFTGRDPFG